MKPVVLYDGNCPLCSKEINHYKKLQGADEISWINIHEKNEFQKYNIDFIEAMKKFHVRNEKSEWITGGDAFIFLWSKLKPYKNISKLITFLKLNGILNWAYNIWAKWKFKKDCNIQNCSIK